MDDISIYVDCETWEHCRSRLNRDISTTGRMQLYQTGGVETRDARNTEGGITDDTGVFLSDAGRVLNLVDSVSASSCSPNKPFYRKLSCSYNEDTPRPPPLVDSTDNCTAEALKDHAKWGQQYDPTWVQLQSEPFNMKVNQLTVDCHGAFAPDKNDEVTDGKPKGCVDCVNAGGQWGFADECQWERSEEEHGSFECGHSRGGRENRCKVHLEAFFPSCQGAGP